MYKDAPPPSPPRPRSFFSPHPEKGRIEKPKRDTFVISEVVTPTARVAPLTLGMSVGPRIPKSVDFTPRQEDLPIYSRVIIQVESRINGSQKTAL